MKKVLVLIENNSGDTSGNLILLGIRETLEREIKITHEVAVDAVQVDNSDSFGAEEYIRDVFLDEDQTPDILVCLSGVYTQCAYQAAVDYNKVGVVQIFGYFDSPQILDALAKNILTVIYCFENDIDLPQVLEYAKNAFIKYAGAQNAETACL